ncbi:MAG: hypothetical protein ACYDH1_10185 [Anaerolineaceae bacterium]
MADIQGITDFDLLQTAANYIRPDLEKNHSMWINSSFEWIIRQPPPTKGKLGKKLVEQWCVLKGLAINRSPDSEADVLINGHRVEVKFSTLWEVGYYKFQQIRNQNFEYCICLGISPSEAHCWVISKSKLLENVIGHMGQHTGMSGQETSWFQVIPQTPPAWLIGCGGSLNEAYLVLRAISRRQI